MSKRKLDLIPDYGKKVRLLRLSMGLSQSQFAQLMGFTKNTVLAVEKGGNPSDRFSAQIESLEQQEAGNSLDQKPNSLSRIGLEAPLIGPRHESNAEIVSVGKIPVVSWTRAGAATDYEELPLDWQKTVPKVLSDPKAFAVEIVGDSMEPRYHAGDVAYLSPSAPVHQNETVIARIKEQGVVFKVYSRKNETVSFSSYNPAYKPFDVPADQISWIYPVHYVMKILKR